MDFPALLAEFTAAVEAGDGARLGALFTPEGVYHDTFYGAYQGREAIARMLEQRFWGDARAFRWDMFDAVCDGRSGYARWHFSYTSTLPGCEGRRAAVPGMSRFELEGGLIRHYSEAFNAGVALAQLGFAPERIGRLLGRWGEALRADPALARHSEE